MPNAIDHAIQVLDRLDRPSPRTENVEQVAVEVFDLARKLALHVLDAEGEINLDALPENPNWRDIFPTHDFTPNDWLDYCDGCQAPVRGPYAREHDEGCPTQSLAFTHGRVTA